MRVRMLIPFGLVLTAILSSGPGSAMGVRPLSMGGAFTGLADDANATYYNPAGLGLLRSSEFTLTHTAGRDVELPFGDEQFIALALKAPRSRMAYAISSYGYQIEFSLYPGNSTLAAEHLYWLSASYQLKPNTYVGANIRLIDDVDPSLHTDLGIDLGVLHIFNSRWSAGLMLQDVNEPQTTTSAAVPYLPYLSQNPCTIRTGIAYRHDKNTVITMDLTDIANRTHPAQLALGAEHILRNGTAVRAGWWRYTSGHYDMRILGLGIPAGRCMIDVALQSDDYEGSLSLGMTGKL